MINCDQKIPWVLLRVRNQLFGVPATHVREMAELPAVTRVPNTPGYVLGLITLRGQVVPTIDLRTRLGLTTAAQDQSRFLDELNCAERTHLDWIARMCESIGDEAAVPADSGLEHCSFTHWLEEAKGDRLGQTSHVSRLEPSHFGIHVLARGALEEAQGGRASAGVFMLREGSAREVAEFRNALTQIRERVSQVHRQIAVVLDWRGHNVAVTVDEVESIERLKNDTLEELPESPEGLVSNLTRLAGRRVRDNSIVLVLEVATLFEGAAIQAQTEPETAGEDLALPAAI